MAGFKKARKPKKMLLSRGTANPSAAFYDAGYGKAVQTIGWSTNFLAVSAMFSLSVCQLC